MYVVSTDLKQFAYDFCSENIIAETVAMRNIHLKLNKRAKMLCSTIQIPSWVKVVSDCTDRVTLNSLRASD